MNVRVENLPTVYLKAGEMHYSRQPSLVVTVLGSCLSVTMYDPKTGTGGICHGLLPECEDKNRCTPGCMQAFKYVDCSVRRMIRIFDKAGASRSEVEVKYFGGADMFARKIEKPGLVSVGRQNIVTAEAILKREGFTISRQDVGGLRGRKLLFYTHTGDVLLKRLTTVNDPDIKW